MNHQEVIQGLEVLLNEARASLTVLHPTSERVTLLEHAIRLLKLEFIKS